MNREGLCYSCRWPLSFILSFQANNTKTTKISQNMCRNDNFWRKSQILQVSEMMPFKNFFCCRITNLTNLVTFLFHQNSCWKDSCSKSEMRHEEFSDLLQQLKINGSIHAFLFQLLTDDNALYGWLTDMEEFGFCLIKNADKQARELEKLTSHISFHRTTHYG